MKKLCAVMLFVFVATLVATTAFAALPTITRNHIDYRPIPQDIKHNIRSGINVGLTNDVGTAQGAQNIIRHVSKDSSGDWGHVGKWHRYINEPTVARRLGQRSSDYQLMRMYSPDARIFFDVPQSVVNMLYGGNGALLEGNANKDPYGFALERSHAYEIVNMLAVNPADGGHIGEGGVMAVHMFSVDITAGQALGKDTIAVPVGLNYEFYSSDEYPLANHFYRESGATAYHSGTSERALKEFTIPEAGRAVVHTPDSPVNDPVVRTSPWTHAAIVGYPEGAVDGTSYIADRWTFGTNRFAGMRADEIKLVKVYGNADSRKQIPFQHVATLNELEHGKFVIQTLARNATNPGYLAASDRVPANALVRIIFAVRDQEPGFDFTTVDSFGVIVDPVVVYAENPFLKEIRTTAAHKAGYRNTVEELVWNKDFNHYTLTDADLAAFGADSSYNGRSFGIGVSSGAFRIASMTGPGIAASHPDVPAVWAFMDDLAHPSARTETFLNDYTATVRDTFDLAIGGWGARNDNMIWIKDSVIEDNYGFDLESVHQFPMTLGRTTARQNTGIVMFSIREMDAFVGKRVSDVRVVNHTGDNFGSPQYYDRVHSAAEMVNGTFAVFTADPAYGAVDWSRKQYDQHIMGADEEFEEGKAYFIALAAKDGGDFDVQQGRQGVADSKNDRVIHFSAFAVVGGTTPTEPVLVVGPSTRTVAPGDTLPLEATRSDTGAAVNVEWSSSDEAVATVDEDGLFTAVAVGTVQITATPVAPVTTNVPDEDLDPVTVTFTVAQDAPPVGGSSGGCSVGGFAPATLLLLAPLFLLLKK